MVSAVVNAQNGDDDPDSQDDDYDSDSQYTQPTHQYGQQPQQPNRPNSQQPLQYSQSNYQPWQQPVQSGSQSWQQSFQPGFQPWQQSGIPILQGYQQQSSYIQALSPSDECGKISEEYGLVPFKTWGKSTEPMKTTWGQRGCDQLLCQYWHKKYDVKPFESNGKMSRNIIPAWGHKQMECNYRVGPYSIAQCKAASEKFSTSPLGIWGTIPEYAKPLWTQGDCDVKMCGIWKAKYGVVKGKTYGSLPVDFKRLWDDPRLLCTDKI
ncbi:hypothetical protein BASA50_009787 [Batrachochytrium salamandrivorans]|uniref:Uncharacterized protein n=1 Tax=Batrachochytrium salamandrivorans TaxID=1357716 RepID=A0ABQ8F0D9_9FUNG|nr:hypothetical protein BASA50_009787 [Batrachochytrium salamandrivorans]